MQQKFKNYDPSETEIKPAKFPMSWMKPLDAQWIQKIYDR